MNKEMKKEAPPTIGGASPTISGAPPMTGGVSETKKETPPTIGGAPRTTSGATEIISGHGKAGKTPCFRRKDLICVDLMKTRRIEPFGQTHARQAQSEDLRSEP